MRAGGAAVTSDSALTLKVSNWWLLRSVGGLRAAGCRGVFMKTCHCFQTKAGPRADTVDYHIKCPPLMLQLASCFLPFSFYAGSSSEAGRQICSEPETVGNESISWFAAVNQRFATGSTDSLTQFRLFGIVFQTEENLQKAFVPAHKCTNVSGGIRALPAVSLMNLIAMSVRTSQKTDAGSPVRSVPAGP